MEAPRGRSLILLLMCMSVPNLAQQLTCPPGDYSTDDGICCNKCSPGFKLVAECRAKDQRTKCMPCSAGEYTDQMNFSYNCKSCKRCRTNKHEIQVSPCEKFKDTKCRCKDGYYKYNIDSGTYECLPCSKCGLNEKEKQTCTSEKDTVCECKENYYRVKKKCEPCQNCTVAECSQFCSLAPVIQNTKDPHAENAFLINIIAAVVATALVLLGLVMLVTYMTTKKFTKKKLLKHSPKQSSSPSDSFQIPFIDEPSDNHSDTAVYSVSELEALKLPDCVPLEIKISELIYTVLDLVPVLKVKQLVRILGVKDTEIEQAEMDHRSCREAHYQMLRVWAERGSRASGGRGGMLHLPLLEELLDQLRKMHLGQAAEELETKYDIP